MEIKMYYEIGIVLFWLLFAYLFMDKFLFKGGLGEICFGKIRCRMAKEFLKDREYEVVDAEENPELSDRFGIMQAPTLVQVGRDGEVKKYVNASNIRRFVEESR